MRVMKELGFDYVDLLSAGWNIYFLQHQTYSIKSFLKQNSINSYLRIGLQPTLVVSVLNEQPLLICGVLSLKSFTKEQKIGYCKTLASISRYCRLQKRGKHHPIRGQMYAYGWRRSYLDSGFNQYEPPPYRKKDSVTVDEWNEYKNSLDLYIQHLGSLFQQYFPKQAQAAIDIQKQFHSPSLADTHAGNLVVTYNFQSAPHTDDDKTFAIGGWFNKIEENGWIKGGEFVFPEYKVAVELNHGTVICWNSKLAKHATIPCQQKKCFSNWNSNSTYNSFGISIFKSFYN